MSGNPVKPVVMEPDSTSWWGEPDIGVLSCPMLPPDEPPCCAAQRMWNNACAVLDIADPLDAWQQLEESAPSDSLWHTLRNCVAYQAGVWQNLLTKDIEDVHHPAAFKLAVVLRHTPTVLVVKLLSEMLEHHDQAYELTSYVLALLTDDAATICYCGGIGGMGNILRDMRLFGDLELAVLAAAREEYDAHAKRVRQEYVALTHHHYVELRVKVLNQLSEVPILFHTPEFECFEDAARENVEREILTLREHLLTGRRE